jgi:uncharacterized protein (TIRG00374 family)
MKPWCSIGARTGALRWGLTLGGLAFLVAAVTVAATSSSRIVTRVETSAVVLGLGITAALTGLSAQRWRMLTEHLLGAPPRGFWIYYRSFILGRTVALVLPATAADLGVRPLIYRLDARSSGLSAFSGAVLEKLFDVWILLLSAGASLLLLLRLVDRRQFFLCLVLVHLGWIPCLRLVGPWAARIAPWLGGRLRSALPRHAVRLERVARSMEAAGRLLLTAEGSIILRDVALLSLARYALIAVQLAVVGQALGTSGIGVLETVVALPAGQAGVLLALTPGGLGLYEAGLWAALAALGLRREEVAVFVVGQRLLISAYVVVLAGLTWSMAALRRA